MNRKNTNSHQYEDIISLPHHVSSKHPQMSLYARAAQFSPFAALTGHEAAIRETARLTDERVELDEDTKSVLDGKLRILQELLKVQPDITVTYFQPDPMKTGGKYVSLTGKVKKIDISAHCLVMTEGSRILLEDIFDIEGDVFGSL